MMRRICTGELEHHLESKCSCGLAAEFQAVLFLMAGKLWVMVVLMLQFCMVDVYYGGGGAEKVAFAAVVMMVVAVVVAVVVEAMLTNASHLQDTVDLSMLNLPSHIVVHIIPL